MKQLAPLALLATSTALAGPASAQDTIQLDEIVISGGLTPFAAESYGRANSVLTADDIEKRQLTHVTDALRTLPGVHISQAGPSGGLTEVRLRGSEANHTLILIDGVEVQSPESGSYDLGNLLAADIERIEVLRGPQSSLYGSNAIGGVIAITTRSATTEGTRSQAGFDITSDGGFGGDFSVQQRAGGASLSFSSAYRETTGYDVSQDPGGDKDGDRNLTFNAKGETTLTSGVVLGATLNRVDRTSEYDTFNFGAATSDGLVTDADEALDRQTLSGSVYARFDALGGRMANEVTYSFSAIETQYLSAGVETFSDEGQRSTVRAQTTLALDADNPGAANHTLTAAVEQERERYDTPFWAPRKRENLGLVVEYRGSFAQALDVQLGLRRDFNDKFADTTTWSAGASYRLPNGATRLHGSAGTGVQNPTLFEQFGFAPTGFVGNPDLKPEHSEGWDIGVEHSFLTGRGVVDITYFSEKLTDEIVTFPATINQTGESERQGVEVAARLAATDRLDLGLDYTWTDAKDPNGDKEVRRPEHDLGLSIGYLMPNDRTRVTLDVQYVGGLTDTDLTAPSFGTGTVDLDDYTLVNLAVSHQMSDSLTLKGRIANLLDTDYEELDGYGGQGLTATVGLQASW